VAWSFASLRLPEIQNTRSPCLPYLAFCCRTSLLALVSEGVMFYFCWIVGSKLGVVGDHLFALVGGPGDGRGSLANVATRAAVSESARLPITGKRLDLP